MSKINGLHHGVRVNTRSSELRTSSNKTFNEQVRSGLGQGAHLAQSAINQFARPFPGSAILSSTVSEAARNLQSSSSLQNTGTANIDGDTGNLQDEMIARNNELLKAQMEVGHTTNSYAAKSNMLKAYQESQKTIGTNIR